MGICENCGNNYDKSFQLTMNGRHHTFDSFECAINMLAPHCDHCDTRVIGHGVEADGKIYCCGHCAHQKNISDIRDRVDHNLLLNKAHG